MGFNGIKNVCSQEGCMMDKTRLESATYSRPSALRYIRFLNFVMPSALCALRSSSLPSGEGGRVRGAMPAPRKLAIGGRYALPGLRSPGFWGAVGCAMLFLGIVGCQAALTKFLPPLEEEGEVYLYMQSYPQEADRLRFTIDQVFAIGSGGKEFPLDVHLHEIKWSDVRRQRLIASGRVPPGSYTGFSFKIKKATLKSEEGESDLLIPETPVRNEFNFNVNRKTGYVFSLAFKYRESIGAGMSFTPVFSVSIPAKPILSLVGYVSNIGASNLVVYDKKAYQVTRVIPVGRGPAGMALDQRGRRLYVANSGDNEILVIDILADQITSRIKLPTGDRPVELALAPDGRTLLSVNPGTNTVSFIDPSSLIELNRVNVGYGPRSITIDPAGRRAYVFSTLSGTITVLDMANRAVITTFSTDPGPLRGDFSPTGDKLYVIHELSSYLAVIDPMSFRVLRRFSIGPGMISIKVNSRTGDVYIGRNNDIFVGVYNPSSFVAVDLIRAGGTVNYMTIDDEENNLYMVSSELKRVIVSNLVRKKILYEIDVGEAPYWVSVMGENLLQLLRTPVFPR
jgi:YVTN family beta-propeller protein